MKQPLLENRKGRKCGLLHVLAIISTSFILLCTLVLRKQSLYFFRNVEIPVGPGSEASSSASDAQSQGEQMQLRRIDFSNSNSVSSSTSDDEIRKQLQSFPEFRERQKKSQMRRTQSLSSITTDLSRLHVATRHRSGGASPAYDSSPIQKPAQGKLPTPPIKLPQEFRHLDVSMFPPVMPEGSSQLVVPVPQHPVPVQGLGMKRSKSAIEMTSSQRTAKSRTSAELPSLFAGEALPEIDEMHTGHRGKMKVSQPMGVTPWAIVSKFRPPVQGEKNLFVYWGGLEPGPLVGSFINAINTNRGDFNLFLITEQNREQYMTQVVDGKQIAPDHKTKLPKDTHISWEVYDRILSAGKLPIATQHDFIVNIMVTFFGGVYMDPGLLGPGKLDYWWKVMHDNGANYLNYADGPHRELNVVRKTKVEIDKQGLGKWNGDMWIDTFFTMTKAHSSIMECFLLLTGQDPHWGPLPSQINRSLFFIYGGDVFDACFASVYETHIYKQVEGLPKGVNLYPQRSDKRSNLPPGSGRNSRSSASSSDDSTEPEYLIHRNAIRRNRRPQHSSRMASPIHMNMRKRRSLGVTDEYKEELMEYINSMLFRMVVREHVDNEEERDPPSIVGIEIPFDYDGNAIILDQFNGDDAIVSNCIPRDRYTELMEPLTDDFDSLFEMGHPTAYLVQQAINLLVVPNGGVYLKFYGTGTPTNPFRLMTWEQLCGPPITFIMYLQKAVTGFDVCSGTPNPIAKVRPIPNLVRAPSPPPPSSLDEGYSSTDSSASDDWRPRSLPSPILKSPSSSTLLSKERKIVSFDSGLDKAKHRAPGIRRKSGKVASMPRSSSQSTKPGSFGK